MSGRIQVESRAHVQWKVRFPIDSCKESEPFKIGIWNWILSVENRSRRSRSGRKSVCVRLFPKLSLDEEPPLARFTFNVVVDRWKETTVDHNGLLCTREDFVVPFKVRYCPVVLIDVSFWELKISPSDGGGGEDISIFPCDDRSEREARRSCKKCLARMLNEYLLTDITINTRDGKLEAHRAVLSASSPVFHSMFLHDLKEKQSSTIDIEDMTSDSCLTLLNYMYGTISKEDFWKHRLALLAAANKYNIQDLKDSCEESLLEDIGLENVLERLQEAWLYQLTKLKKGCITYLIDSGKIEQGMSDFFRMADRELVEEMFQEMVSFKKGESETKQSRERKRKRKKRNE